MNHLSGQRFDTEIDVDDLQIMWTSDKDGGTGYRCGQLPGSVLFLC